MSTKHPGGGGDQSGWKLIVAGRGKGVEVGVFDGDGVGVLVGDGVAVEVGVSVPVGASVPVGEALGVGVVDGVGVGVGVGDGWSRGTTRQKAAEAGAEKETSPWTRGGVPDTWSFCEALYS